MPANLSLGLETGELTHLLPHCLFLAFARPTSTPWALLDHRTRTQPPLLAELGPVGVVLGCCASALRGGSFQGLQNLTYLAAAGEIDLLLRPLATPGTAASTAHFVRGVSGLRRFASVVSATGPRRPSAAAVTGWAGGGGGGGEGGEETCEPGAVSAFYYARLAERPGEAVELKSIFCSFCL